MIAVIGRLLYRQTDHGGVADGTAARIAVTAAAAGQPVQFVGKVGEDPEGDAVLLDLARAGVGHVAVLRDAGTATAQVSDPRGSEPDGGLADGRNDPDAAVGAASEDHQQLDAADIELALRYLTDVSVLVLGIPVDAGIVRVIEAAASWADARLILIVPSGGVVPDGLPADAIVFEAPDADPDGVFAAMVGSFAAALDDGGDPATAFRSTVAAEGWTPAADAT